MRKPGQMKAFDALYAIAAGGGRKEALFGSSYDLARPAYERTLIGSGYPTAYLEFPLLGEPCFDLLSVHGGMEPGSRFAPGAGFGYQTMFNWFAGVCQQYGTLGCGIELDTSTGETERAGVYLQQREHHELVQPFLESVGEAERARDYLDMLGRMPKGWPPAYVGLFPGRPGTPMRIGGYMSHDELARCKDDPAHLEACFQAIGFTDFDDAMLERCTEFMRLVPAIDFQFDILPNGRLGNTFGLSLSFNDTMPREAKVCMESGYGATLMRTLQGWGLVDDRWKLIADAAFAKHVGYEREDGTEGRFALCIRFNYAKVKFRAREPQPAKFYLTCAAGDVEAS
ncbi:MAG: hypothetical protein Q4A01_06575 [Coriobacteriales bacterium]|nr:hypothetical protein [Coriobacteriales bacterium]